MGLTVSEALPWSLIQGHNLQATCMSEQTRVLSLPHRVTKQPWLQRGGLEHNLKLAAVRCCRVKTAEGSDVWRALAEIQFTRGAKTRLSEGSPREHLHPAVLWMFL